MSLELFLIHSSVSAILGLDFLISFIPIDVKCLADSNLIAECCNGAMAVKQLVLELRIAIGVEEGFAGGLQPPYLSRNLLHSGSFHERTIGNFGSFSDFALPIRAELLQSP